MVGNIYKGRVSKVLPGMQSSFVDIGLERDAFLYVSEVVNTVEEFDRLESGDDDEPAMRWGKLSENRRACPEPRILRVEGHPRLNGVYVPSVSLDAGEAFASLPPRPERAQISGESKGTSRKAERGVR